MGASRAFPLANGTTLRGFLRVGLTCALDRAVNNAPRADGTLRGLPRRSGQVRGGASWQVARGVEIGSITPGKLANFVILEQSPYAVPAPALKDIAAWGTVLEGRVQPAPPAPTAPPRRAEAPAGRLGGGSRASGRFRADAGDAVLADACAGHVFCVHTGADGALGCGCGGDVFGALISAALTRGAG